MILGFLVLYFYFNSLVYSIGVRGIGICIRFQKKFVLECYVSIILAFHFYIFHVSRLWSGWDLLVWVASLVLYLLEKQNHYSYIEIIFKFDSFLKPVFHRETCHPIVPSTLHYR